MSFSPLGVPSINVRKAAIAFALLVCVTVGDQSPTGDCSPTTDGGRIGYHSPGDAESYLPDCSLQLDRSLWRVFVTKEQRAYVSPRPDGMGLKYGFCNGSNESLSALFTQYELCTPAPSEDAIRTINSMAPGDALRITQALHGKLVFEGEETRINPIALEDDILAACNYTNHTGALEHCELLRARCNDGECLDYEVLMSVAVAEALAVALNKLYGIRLGDAFGA